MSSMMARRARSLAPVLAVSAAVALAAACGTSAEQTATPTSTTVGRVDASGTVWLCRPGVADNPCLANLTTTVVRADGTKSVRRSAPAKHPPIDCFYVYPTVSRQKTANANLHVDPEETAVAMAQASRFSQVCKVYAPMYPQLTTTGIGLGGRTIDAKAAATAYLGVLSAWKDYLAHDNHQRGVVLIGHSQGSSLLIPLIRREIDPSPTERQLLVSALLMGGNVTVPTGQTEGGDFKNIPACQSNQQIGCVVAYSSFDTTPPPGQQLLRPGGERHRCSVGTGLHPGRRRTGPVRQPGVADRRNRRPAPVLRHPAVPRSPGDLRSEGHRPCLDPLGQLSRPLCRDL